jgi:hypothetical protein
MRVAAGDQVAVFADGTADLQGLWFEPRHLLWWRIGADGDATELIDNHETLTASQDGTLFVALRPPTILWTDRRGTFPAPFVESEAVPVEFEVELLRLNGDARAALEVLAAGNDPDASAALAAADARKPLPGGFEHLWFLGRANVWTNGALDGRPGITADTDDDASIVRLPLNVDLTDETEFVFDWRYDTLPALGPETSAEFHDYLSVALEFDNGQDLTWMWSRELPEDSHFACPLPGWENRETHWVLQNGEAGLGDWFSHRRNVLSDYRAAIAGDAPGRIVAVWFIANSLFGRQQATASFADVAIESGEARREIFSKP